MQKIIDYIKDESNAPKLIQGEEVYLWQDGITLREERGKFLKGEIQLTTYHFFWYSISDTTQPILKIPLFYIKGFKTSKGWLRNSRMEIELTNFGQNPPYAKALYLDILKVPIPPVPNFPKEIKLEFTTGGVEKVDTKFNEALSGKHWMEIGSKKEEIKFISKGFQGIAGIKKSIQSQSAQMASTIATSFTDLNSLKDSAKKLVNWAII